jgi:hypothetical protein
MQRLSKWRYLIRQRFELFYLQLGGSVKADIIETTATSLAALAQSVEHKLRFFNADLDPDRAKALLKKWPFVAGLSPPAQASASERKVWLQMTVQQCGGLPPLVEFSHSAARLALLPRVEIHTQLCALAIARRPGVLRCCIDKQKRLALRTALGPTFLALNTLARSSKAVSILVTDWPVLRWVCVGYRDWYDTIAPKVPTIHQLVALSLPELTLAEVMESRSEPAEYGAGAAVKLLATQGLSWPS